MSLSPTELRTHYRKLLRLGHRAFGFFGPNVKVYESELRSRFKPSSVSVCQDVNELRERLNNTEMFVENAAVGRVIQDARRKNYINATKTKEKMVFPMEMEVLKNLTTKRVNSRFVRKVVEELNNDLRMCL